MKFALGCFGAAAWTALGAVLLYGVIERQRELRRIRSISRLTTEMLEDYPATRDYINQRLPFVVAASPESHWEIH